MGFSDQAHFTRAFGSILGLEKRRAAAPRRARQLADRVPVPVRLVTGSGTATPAGAQRFTQRMTAPHDVVSLPGTRFDFYDDPVNVAEPGSTLAP